MLSSPLSALTMVAATLLLQSARAQEVGWRSLINGRDLAGWEHVGDGMPTVEGGLLRTGGGFGLLVYAAEQFGPAEIRVEYCHAPGANSGIFVRVMPKPDSAMPPLPGLEIQIGDAESSYHTTGSVYTFSEVTSRPSRPNEWNTMVITLDGARTIVRINGVKVTEFSEGDSIPPRGEWWEPEPGRRPSRGYIAIQTYPGVPPVYFRSIEVRDLPGVREPGTP